MGRDMKKYVLRMFVFLFFAFLVFACKKNEVKQVPSVSNAEVEKINNEIVSAVAANNEKPYQLESASSVTLKTEFKNLSKQVPAQAHAKYLNDPAYFDPFDFSTNLTPDNITAVVGSDVCKFYAGAILNSFEDVEKLKSETLIPIGTVLKLTYRFGVLEEDSGKKIVGGEFYKSEYGYIEAASGEPIEFEDEWNYFYTTEYNGKTGLVFGADLRGEDYVEFENRIIGELYKNGGVPEKFLPSYRGKPLSPEVKTSLEKYRIAFESIPAEELRDFDEMVSLYVQDIRYWMPSDHIETCQPIFITNDFVSHAKHVLFDESLQKAEQNYFIPKLDKFVKGFLAALEKVNTPAGKITADEETLQKARDYFNVAKALIALAPEEKQEEYREVEYIEKDKTAVLAPYSETVKHEIALIEAAAGIMNSPLFSFADGSSNKEDYTQYKVRGHYTKNPILGTYFKTMMWFGRTNFIISEGSNESTAGASTAGELTHNMLPIALLITEIVNQDPNLLQHWKNIFDPLTALIGASDDLSFYECLPLWKNLGVTDFAAWSGDKKNREAFIKLAAEKLSSPVISGNSLFQAASAGSSEERKPPMGFRLFGQRYTIDSFIFHETSTPRMLGVDGRGETIGRDMVSVLDVLTCFGSKRAALMLSPSYSTFEKLPLVLDAFKNAIEKNGAEKAFGKTYYGSVLQELVSIAQFESGAGFYFTETPYWDLKQLNTGLGVYAELKHDTILYAKQAYAELGGGPGCTTRTKEVPRLLDYVEPNSPYFESVIMSLSFLHEIYEAYGLADENTLSYIKKFIEHCKKLLEIVKLEIQDKPVSKELLAEIKKTPSILASCMQFQNYTEVSDHSKNAAIAADVFTNAETGQVLESATGIPYRMYIALNDGQGGKRIAVGYCFNGYEFAQAADNRLTDEQWQEKVYEQIDAQMLEYKPYWLDKELFGN